MEVEEEVPALVHDEVPALVNDEASDDEGQATANALIDVDDSNATSEVEGQGHQEILSSSTNGG